MLDDAQSHLAPDALGAGSMSQFGLWHKWSDWGPFAQATLIVVNVLPNGKSLKLYGTSFYSVGDKQPFLEDWAALFRLLEEGNIKPVIAKKFPILEAAQAQALLESGKAIGNVVLVAPASLEGGVWKDWLSEEASDACGEQTLAQAGSKMRSSHTDAMTHRTA
jgi:hypothetical protein